MTNQHPITPPPELVEQWRTQPEFAEPGLTTVVSMTCDRLRHIATQAARWGGDQELEACCALMDDWGLDAADLRAARRPQPQPLLREQALSKINAILNDQSRVLQVDERKAFELSRRALEQLPEGPAVTPAADDRGPDSVAPDASPVATDKHIADVFERIAGWRYNYPHTLAALRAIYDLGREHGAASVQSQPLPVTTLQPGDRLVVDDDGQPTGVLRSDPAPTADGRFSLWELMRNEYNKNCGDKISEGYAAELRVVADWLERMGDGTPWMEASEVFATSLRAEAERAEAGVQ